MPTAQESTLDIVRARIGSAITRIRRIHYEFQGSLNREEGDMELWFGNLVLWFRGAAHGQALRVDQEAWKDYFAPHSVQRTRHL